MSTNEAPPHSSSTPTERRLRLWLTPRLPGRGWKSALREFALIVAGVLAALAAQEWWQEREERARERKYLQLYVADVQENEATLEEAIRGDSLFGVILNERLWPVIEGTAPLPPHDTLGEWLRHAHIFHPAYPVNGTYTALIETGDIRLLRDEPLRAHLIQYAARAEGNLRVLSVLETQTGESVRIMAERREHHRRGAASTRAGGGSAIDYEAMLSDPVVRGTIDTARTLNRNRLAALRAMREDMRALRSQLSTPE